MSDRMSARTAVPSLSIGMAVYNGADHVREALESLLAQTWTDFEIVISDNGSVDGTPEICDEYAARDPRVRVIRQPTNLGPARNFAYVLEQARGPYFMFAAHDDLWEPAFAQRLIEELTRSPDAVLAFSRWDAINQRGEHIMDFDEPWPRILSGGLFARLWSFVTLDEGETLKALFYYGIMRRSIWLDVFSRWNDYDAYAGSDALMVVDMAARGRFAFVDDVLFHNRIRALRRREGGQLARYIVKRARGRAPGHRGSAAAMLSRVHQYHAGVRDVIGAIAGLTVAEKSLLRAITYARELRGYSVGFPVAVLRELGLLAPARLAKAAE